MIFSPFLPFHASVASQICSCLVWRPCTLSRSRCWKLLLHLCKQSDARSAWTHSFLGRVWKQIRLRPCENILGLHLHPWGSLSRRHLIWGQTRWSSSASHICLLWLESLCLKGAGHHLESTASNPLYSVKYTKSGWSEGHCLAQFGLQKLSMLQRMSFVGYKDASVLWVQGPQIMCHLLWTPPWPHLWTAPFKFRCGGRSLQSPWLRDSDPSLLFPDPPAHLPPPSFFFLFSFFLSSLLLPYYINILFSLFCYTLNIVVLLKMFKPCGSISAVTLIHNTLSEKADDKPGGHRTLTWPSFIGTRMMA